MITQKWKHLLVTSADLLVINLINPLLPDIH